MPIRSSHQHAGRGANLFAHHPVSSVYRKIAYTFVGITLVVAIGALWLSSVRARITVNMKHDVTTVDASVDIAKNPDTGQLHGRVVRGTFEKIQDVPVKEGTAAPTESATRGTVKIVNNYSKPQTLVEKTRLLTSDNRLYRIDKTVTIQPKQSVQVAAHSDQIGASYALPAGTKLTIPGLWIDIQKWIYAETVTSFDPSSATGKKTVTDAQLTDAYTTLGDAVFEDAKKALAVEASTTDDWSVVYDKKIVEKKSNVTNGQAAESFLASVKLDVTAVYYPKKEIDALIRLRLKEKLPDERELIAFDPAQATYTIEQADTQAETARLHIVAQAVSRLTDKSPQLAKTNFLGLSEADAKTKLQAIDGVDSVDIRIRPTWIHTVPTNAGHVELIVQ